MMNPYQPTREAAIKLATRQHSWFLSVTVLVTAASVSYVVGDLVALAITSQTIPNLETMGISLVPLMFGVPIIVIVFYFTKSRLLIVGSYLVTGVFFAVLAGAIEEVYPVFIGIRSEFFVSILVGTLLSSLSLWVSVWGAIGEVATATPATDLEVK